MVPALAKVNQIELSPTLMSQSDMNDGRPDPPERAVDDRNCAALVIDVHELLQGHREIQLRLDKTVYRLRLTRFGKLVLTK